MNKRLLIIIIPIALTIIILTYLFLNIFNADDEKKEEIPQVYTSETIEDECTEEYIKLQNTTTVSSTQEEKLSANAILILKKYFINCDHTINEYVELPQELVNMTKDEVQAQYPEWEVIGFEANKLTLYKEFEDECGEHFILRIEDGKVIIYLLNKDGTESLYEKTDISSEYLTETDLLEIEQGLEVFGKEELNKIIEDFE